MFEIKIDHVQKVLKHVVVTGTYSGQSYIGDVLRDEEGNEYTVQAMVNDNSLILSGKTSLAFDASRYTVDDFEGKTLHKTTI